MSRRRPKHQVERYPIERSPLALNPTQRQLATLVGMKRDALRGLATHRDTWIVRRDEIINGKARKLAYPRGRLRRVHEILKYHLQKIEQPDYLFSPRKGRSQRDNAARHSSQVQYLTLDIKQFYPSTTSRHIRTWLQNDLGTREDTAGLLVKLVTVDGIASFGSPLTPLLATLVHRRLFDDIAALCRHRGLKLSLWVDDLTISGLFVPGTLLANIREIVRANRLKSHKLTYRHGNRPVLITGIGVVGSHLIAPRSLHERIHQLYLELAACETLDEFDDVTNKLLSACGTLRYIVGPKSPAGQRASNRMNTLRQRRQKKRRMEGAQIVLLPEKTETLTDDADLPWD